MLGLEHPFSLIQFVLVPGQNFIVNWQDSTSITMNLGGYGAYQLPTLDAHLDDKVCLGG